MPVPYSPLAVANEFIQLASPNGLDHMKLQKLCYYAQGIALTGGSSLINEQPQVWKYGPVFKGLYSELKYHGAKLITAPEHENVFGAAPRVDPTDSTAAATIKKVWDKLRNYTALQLSDMTHKPGTPWSDLVLKLGGRIPVGTEITAGAMTAYFKDHPL